MRVTGIEVFVLRAKQQGVDYWGARAWGDSGVAADSGRSYPPMARRTVAYSPSIDTVLVRLETDDGVVGWGEAKAPVASEATAEIIRALLVPIVVGTGIDEIAVTWERMFACMGNRGHHSGFLLEAISGVDIALWDAWGKSLSQPVTALLGGKFRNSVPVYASGIPAGGPGKLDDVKEQARDLKARGYSAIKVAIGMDPESDIGAVAAVRDVLGSDGRVFADASGSYDSVQAEWVGRRLWDLGCGFFEMPLPAQDLQGYARLASRLAIPIALDTLTTRRQSLAFLQSNALRILQPDVSRAGGITETIKIAQLADAYGAQATPHVSIGSAVQLAASLQVALALPNCEILEHWTGTNPLGVQIASNLDQPDHGERTAGSGSGLGITVEEDVVRSIAKA